MLVRVKLIQRKLKADGRSTVKITTVMRVADKPFSQSVRSIIFKKHAVDIWHIKSVFAKLTQIPILIVYGGNIATEPSEIFNVDVWRLSKAYAKAFVKEINARGGDATLLDLPSIGIEGNTHVPFADKNNIEIANLMEDWLHKKGLDGKTNPHRGPQPKGLTEFTIPIAQ